MHRCRRAAFPLALAVVGLLAVPTVGADAKCVPDECEFYVDDEGTEASPRRAYENLHRSVEAHPYVALAEELLFLGVGTTWYWLAKDKNLVDWDRPSARQRFTLNVIRFDNNDFPINFTLHPWSGAAYYAAARSNGHSLAVASLYALGATLAWEYGIEFREKISLNDLIFTPLPAVPLGEFFSQLALYVNRPANRHSMAHRIAGVVFGPLQAFSDLVARPRSLPSVKPDALGYSSARFHEFRLYAGVALQSAGRFDGVFADFGVDGMFVNIPSFRRAGRFRRFVHDADFSRFRMAFLQGSDQREFDSYADVTLFGIYEQQITRDLRGGSIFVGASMGYRYRRSLLDGFRDEVAATHLPGLAIEGSALLAGQSVLHVSFRLHADFAGVRSLSYERWQRASPEALGKTTLASHGYVYSFGASMLAEAWLHLSPLRVGGRAWLAFYDSTEGLDRKQEELTADPKGVDRVLDMEGFIALSPFSNKSLAFELAVLARRRTSRLAGYETTLALMRASFRASLAF